MIPMKTIEGSSLLASAGFDPAQGVLQVQYHNGKAYEYQGATQEQFDGLLAADSKGKFFNANIKPLGGKVIQDENVADAEDE